MANIDETSLPGIGTRHDFTLENGERLGVVTHRDSAVRELVLFDPDDPDSCRATVRLSDADTEQLIAVLQTARRGGTRGD